jgi:hypothetical protein
VLTEFCVLGCQACSPVEFSGYLGGICRLHHQGRRVSHARNQQDSGDSAYHLLLAPFLLGLLVNPSETSDDFYRTSVRLDDTLVVAVVGI